MSFKYSDDEYQDLRWIVFIVVVSVLEKGSIPIVLHHYVVVFTKIFLSPFVSSSTVHDVSGEQDVLIGVRLMKL